jgi:MHS family proline/betaine transporter-like MFS transporter
MFDHLGTKRSIPAATTRRLRAEDCIVIDNRDLRKAQVGAGVGNFIEWYDIGIYGYLAVTMTSVFTEGMDERMGLLVTLLGFAVSFVVRPLGGMILGPLGDKIGAGKCSSLRWRWWPLPPPSLACCPPPGRSVYGSSFPCTC